MKRLTLLLLVLLGLCDVSCTTDDDFAPMMLHCSSQGTALLDSLAARYPLAGYAEVMARAGGYSLQGATVAYIGASLANNKECDVAKRMVAEALACRVVTYGHGGYAFGAETETLKSYADQLGCHEVYIIFCTTNDYFRNVPIGSPADCTESDGFDKKHALTACGGLNYLIRQIRLCNPEATVVAFNCPKFFNGVRTDGMALQTGATNDIALAFHDYLDAYRACFRQAGIPCLLQWELDCFTQANWKEFYMEDGVHLNENGYFILGIRQLHFLLDCLTPLGRD